MLDDLVDGAEWAVSQGFADRARLAIYGGSYGGYATLAALAFHPKIFACGIDYVGISNLLTFMSTIPPYWETFRDVMYKRVGNPKTDREFLLSRSPLFAADKSDSEFSSDAAAANPRVIGSSDTPWIHNLYWTCLRNFFDDHGMRHQSATKACSAVARPERRCPSRHLSQESRTGNVDLVGIEISYLVNKPARTFDVEQIEVKSYEAFSIGVPCTGYVKERAVRAEAVNAYTFFIGIPGQHKSGGCGRLVCGRTPHGQQNRAWH